MIKKEQKRIRNNDFEQVEECYECKKLFWAISELGNWQLTCNPCTKELEKKEKLRQDNIRKNGVKVYGYKKRIIGWRLNFVTDEFLPNPAYEVDYKGKINFSNIDDKVRELKGNKSITWHPNLFYLLDYFVRMCGFSAITEPNQKEFTFMGMFHKKGKEGNYEYLV